MKISLGRSRWWVGLFWLAATVAASAQEDPQALGLRPPTEAEKAWMDSHLVRTGEVRLNALGADRVKGEYSRRQLGPPVLPTVVPMGAEVMPAAPEDEAAEGLDGDRPTVLNNTTLPAFVDNSLLPSFPPVRSQGEIGSCAAFSSAYYVGTHMTGLARGWNNTSTSNALKLSPKFVYALINGGADSGSWFSSNLDVLLRLGAPTWEQWNYSGTNTPSSYREWPRDAATWRQAAHHRFAQVGVVTNMHQSSGLEQAKALLNNGYLLLYATDIYGWQYETFRDNPTTTSDQAMVGAPVATYVRTDSSGHAMTIVGYHDDVWVDINKNGVMETGEKGAFKIVNSWGSNWRPLSGAPSIGGFAWISYDALRSNSAVPGANTPSRTSGYRSAFWGNEVYWITARSSYTPTVLAEFSLSHPRRHDLRLRLGRSGTATTTPTVTWPPSTADFNGWQNGSGWPLVFSRLGGAYAFDGGSSNVAGTFAFDLTDLLANGTQRYYLEVNDNASGSSAQVTGYRLTNATGTSLAQAGAGTGGVPFTIDNGTQRAWVDFAQGAPPAFTSAGTATATVGQAFSFQVTASNAPTGFTATNRPPGLSINASTGLIAGTPTTAGTYQVGLGASNTFGSASGNLVVTVSAPLVNIPVISSATTASATTGEAFSYTITASGSPTAFGASGLPPGLSVNTSNGAITGTPTAVGTFVATLLATNAGGTGSRGLTLTVAAAASAPVITSPIVASGASGTSFSYRIEATNNPTSFGVTDLPTGLTLNAATGVIAGLLPTARSYDMVLRATNATGSGYRTLVLTVTGDSSFAPANDAFSNRIQINGPVAAVTGSNVNATAETGEPSHGAAKANRSVWWSWTAPGAGQVTINTTGSNFATILAVYSGNSLATLSQVGVNAGGAGQGASQLTFPVSPGVVYAFAVDGVEAASGAISLQVNFAGQTPPNDNFASRTLLTGTTATTTGSNLNATAETGEPRHDGFDPVRSIWWRWTAPASGVVEVNTIGSDFDTLLGIYTGTAVNALTRIASDDQTGGNNTSLLTFSAVAGVTYAIAVDGWLGASGNAVLTLRPVTAAGPANDHYQNRVTLTGASTSTVGTNVGASAQSGEPAHDGRLPVRSVWWRWVAPAAGEVTIHTVGSAFDTVLAVYGDTSLDPIASNDDFGGTTTSRVTFATTAGVAYAIAVDGYAGATGTIALAVAVSTAVPNDAFAQATLLTGPELRVTANSANATAEAGEPAHAGFAAVRSLWWRWTPSTSGIVRLDTVGSGFDTVLAVYTGSTLTGLTGLAADDDSGGSATSAVTFFATAGVTYRFAVDGYGGASGSVVLNLVQSASGDLYATDFEDFLSGANQLGGTDGWISLPATGGSTGIFEGFPGSQTAWIGFNPPVEETIVFAWRPLNFDPVAAGTPIMRFTVDLKVEDSTNGRYDDFYFAVYNRAGQLLGSINFDNNNLLVYRHDGTAFYATTAEFDNGVRYALSVTMNFAANTWTVSLTDEAGVTQVAFTDAPFTATTSALDLGDISARWDVRTVGEPGDNFMVFDNYRVAVTDLRPNLRPYTPTGWDSALIVATAPGTAGDADVFYDDDGIFVSWAMANDSDTDVASELEYDLLVNGNVVQTWNSASLNANYFNSVEDYDLGSLPAGTHLIEIVADPVNTISETNENDNIFSKVISVLPRLVGPDNDAFAAATVLTAGSSDVAGTNAGASLEAGEPNHAGVPGGRSVWWLWQASANGTVTIETVGSTFDTVLGVYTGTAVNALTLVGSDDDSGGNQASRVVFTAAAGTVYAIAVDGYNGASGSIALSVQTGTSGAVPAIVAQPQDRSLQAGGGTTLQVTASGQPAPSLRWQWRAAGTETWTDAVNGAQVQGATTPTLALSGLNRSRSGDQYRCVATNTAGSTPSLAATIHVTGQPQTVTFGAVADQVWRATPLPLAASASSGLPIGFTVVEGPARVEGNSLQMLGLGAVTVEAGQAGNETFDAAPPVLRTFFVDTVEIIRPEAQAALAAGELSMTFLALVGFEYQAETSADLESWTPLGEPFFGGGENETISLPAGSATTRFLRLRVTRPVIATPAP